ncbi:MAG: aminotransferase class I/II-fold pyridoxal phosphate-dependent enzyme [Eubacteriales bacterium]|nr:aminotransferase class I/II-fold pyridoxal phosphate-dependent enzyme [Eubacteriales bacterium]
MPGHKGESILGFEHLDITEIQGADSLFEASSIIRESEENASLLFGARTYYSTEGSSLCIRAMLYLTLLYAKKEGKAPLILAGRNAHKTFLSSVALLDLDVEWLYSDSSYLSCDINAETLDNKLSSMQEKPVAVYLTSPDYLGNMLDIKAISEVCNKHGVLLLVDNAHGAYLKFLDNSLHPIDLGATMCCDSAHKTLPVLTGGAYLHINQNSDEFFCDKAKGALSLFASTSPSYLILQSLDKANEYIENGYKENLRSFVKEANKLTAELIDNGYELISDEKLKITIATKSYGYEGTEFAQILRENNIECEFCDPDFVVLMLSLSNSTDAISALKNVLLSIKKREALLIKPPMLKKPQRVMSVRDAVMSNSKTVCVSDALNQVLSTVTLSCPPAVPILVCGELIDESAQKCFEYYQIENCDIVVK